MTTAAIVFAYLGGLGFVAVAVALSVRRRRVHPLLLVCVAAISISWIEAPYDGAVYAQFPKAIPRMPAWWPLNKTWGGLPAPVPPGYIAYFVLPAVIGAFIGRRLVARFGWRRPVTLLTTGLVSGFAWALFFNGLIGAHYGVFYYGRVIHGLALFEGTKRQYPLYDALAMGVQVMVFSYLLGSNVIARWAETKRHPSAMAVAAFIVIGHATYLGVFAPHLVTKVSGLVDAGPNTQLFPGVPNQPK